MMPVQRFVCHLTSLLIATALGLVVPWAPASAHEIRPAYLQITESAPGMFDLLFKTPMRGNLRLALEVELSGPATLSRPRTAHATRDAMLQSWQIRTDEPLAGRALRVAGLSNTLTDALVRVEYLDGRTWMQRLSPASPVAIIPARQSNWQVAAGYLRLGVEHILLGIDHLLFVLGLMMIAVDAGRLVKAITAFSAAHSITLAAATLGLVHVPSKPVEAAIALSIVFVAAEAIQMRRGKISLTGRLPWLVAFGFGLLHGLGFAGALSEIGIPEDHIPLALLFFNIGVELGQLAFVSVVLVIVAAARRVRAPRPQWTALSPAYAIGTAAMFWFIQRIVTA
jgi:hydrogenase/urease accessory protein HupE